MKIKRRIIALSALLILSVQLFLYSQEETGSKLTKQTEFITVEDSINLATDLYLPKGSGLFPCILIRSPYSKNNFEINGEGAIRQFLKRGWVVVVQDTRGKFESNGIYEPFRHERPDGLSIVQWIRSQTWSNGKVGGRGGSYVGYTQWAIADQLDVITPIVTSANMYELVYPDDLFSLATVMNWALPNGSRTLNTVDPEKMKESYFITPLSVADDSIFGQIDFPSAENTLGEDEWLELLRGDLMRAESRIRLLNYISKSALDCPVAVIFGHANTMNWAGPSYDDMGMDLADSLWSSGIPADLIPSSEIESGHLQMDENGWISYGDQRYAAVILYHPEFSRESVGEFFINASKGETALYRVGSWTRDFNGQSYGGEELLPKNMVSFDDPLSLLKEIRTVVDRNQIPLQSPATGTLKYSTHTFSAPPTTGHCRLIDGTVIHLAGTENVADDQILSEIKIQNHRASFDAIGIAAVRLDQEGRVETLAAGGLKFFKSGEMDILLNKRIDLAFWINENGEYEGVIQGWEGNIPPQLLKITSNWTHLGIPVPYTN